MEDKISEVIITPDTIEIVTLDGKRFKLNRKAFSYIFSRLDDTQTAHLKFSSCKSCGDEHV